MERWTVGVQTVRRLAVITTVGIALLVVAGGVVRLTGSGLGCDDWPNCNSERFVDVSSGHAAIEQINRIFSGLIGIPTVLLVVAAWRARPHVPGLRAPAVGVLVTVLANGVVGGLAVRGDLHPLLVQSHFLLAMASLAFGMVAIERASPSDVDADVRGAPAPHARVAAVGVTALTALALVTGTVVTGTGPHAGDEDVRRFGFDISAVARVHSITVLLAIGTALALAWHVRRDVHLQRLLGPTLSAWIFLGLVQGGVGYVQYFNGVPELLVGVHIALATLLWMVSIRLIHRVLEPSPSGTRRAISRGVLGAA